MKIITDEQLSVLREVISFLDAYVEYKIDVESVDGEPTDAEVLSKQVPILKGVFENKDVNEMKFEPRKDGMYTDDQTLKNMMHAERKMAEESVNPNYRYCVVESNIDSCHLTDDEVAAMEFAMGKSRSGGMYYVCEIRKVTDGTYKTFIIGTASDGDYTESDSWHSEFLHYNYLASACSIVGKI